MACGEGNYGRLGQGNSDDLYQLTPITALQGNSSFSSGSYLLLSVEFSTISMFIMVLRLYNN